MKELSLHVLDIAGNSVSANATDIRICLESSEEADKLRLEIADNGRGMEPDFLRRVIDPFTTTRTTRKVGMGIPLFKMAAEMAGGSFTIDSTPGVGTTVCAVFQRSHVDLPPIGDMAGTIATLIQGAPDINFSYRYKTDRGEFTLDTAELRETLEGVPLSEPEVLTWITEYIVENEAELS
ncbi:ATP-binding protein [Oscillospiraceae bacterium OttesenSCG-928-G22]|nr:ATP-binding protein [Oscillospiraceae bacterium OttesenSCG-928-G22]